MKNLEELREFYERELAKELRGLERHRKRIGGSLLFAGIVLFIILMISYPLLKRLSGGGSVLVFVAIGLCISLLVMLYERTKTDYAPEFKEQLIGKLVKFLDEGLTYQPNKFVPESLYTESKIFRHQPPNYHGDDLVTGKVGKTKIQFSEIHSHYEGKKRRDNKKSYEMMFFHGLFFVGDFNKEFTCRLVVLPDKAERLLGHMGKTLQSLNPARDKLIKLEDAEFEKYFAVYGNDEIEARYILSPSMMQRIVDFKKKTEKEIYLSFQNSKVFVAIPYEEDLFEPKIYQSLLKFETIRPYFEDLQLSVGIVEDLDLNTRIWSKE